MKVTSALSIAYRRGLVVGTAFLAVPMGLLNAIASAVRGELAWAVYFWAATLFIAWLARQEWRRHRDGLKEAQKLDLP